MSVTIESSRFGMVEIADEAVIEFPSGLIGLAGSRYALVARDPDDPFVWLHSIDDPSLAIPVTVPWKFFGDYSVEISDDEAARIGLADAADADVYVTVRAGEEIDEFTVNLRAPILVSHGRGWQVLNEAPEAPLRAPLFSGIVAERVEAA